VDPETRFRALFDRAYPALGRYARHRGLTGPDAEDLVSQTLEIAWRRLDEVPGDDPLPWLYAVARNLRRNQTRRDRRRRELLARFRSPRPPGDGWDPACLEPGMLRTALASLSDRDQEVLRLVAWDGLSPAELAVALGCSPVAARSRLHRARGRLAASLGIGPDPQHLAAPGQNPGDSLDSLGVPQ
jgi:RNA polymerase sigma factor (sigma-70 family)